MKKIKIASHAYVLKAWNGRTFSYASLKDLVKDLEEEGDRFYWAAHIGLQFEERHPSYLVWCDGYYRRVRGEVCRTNTFVIRQGSHIIAPWDLPWTAPHRRWNKKRIEHTAVHRRDPVPGVHKGRCSIRRKPPATLQEKRYGCDDIECVIRPKRRPHLLPSGYDMPFRKKNRSWKHHRPHQWKEKGIE